MIANNNLAPWDEDLLRIELTERKVRVQYLGLLDTLFARTANGQTMRRQICRLVRRSQGRPIEIELPSCPPDETAVREARSVLRVGLLVAPGQLRPAAAEAMTSSGW